MRRIAELDETLDPEEGQLEIEFEKDDESDENEGWQPIARGPYKPREIQAENSN